MDYPTSTPFGEDSVMPDDELLAITDEETAYVLGDTDRRNGLNFLLDSATLGAFKFESEPDMLPSVLAGMFAYAFNLGKQYEKENPSRET